MDEPKDASDNAGRAVLTEMHHAFLEALRQREKEIFSYLSTLGLAFGGFGWLLVQENSKAPPTTMTPFIFGTVGVLLLLSLGAVYALALGYNYRYITFQLAKIEHSLNIKDVMLKAWPRSAEDFAKYSWWCAPPEIIQVFWIAFIVGIVVVTCFASSICGMPNFIWPIGAVLFLASALGPLYFGYRFRRLQKKESSWS